MAIKIKNMIIGEGHPPFIIAEMSGNHNQSLERALEIVKAASMAGAHALKIQTYTPDTMTLNLSEREFYIEDPKSLWKGKSLYELYKEAMTPWEWHRPIKEACEKLGMIFFSTPFDETAVDFLESLNVDLYKIASFENTDHELLKKVAKTGKPIIMSTGMASLSELEESLTVLRQHGAKDIVLLKCTSAYPSDPREANLKTIAAMRDIFQVDVGLSDHTMGIGVAIASIGLGATVIEKHFTLDRKEGGVDSAFSMEPHEFKMLAEESQRAHASLGTINFEVSATEKHSLKFRRTLYITKDLAKGDVITKDHVRAIRPGLGLPVKHYHLVLGSVANCDIKKGTALTFDHLIQREVELKK